MAPLRWKISYTPLGNYSININWPRRPPSYSLFSNAEVTICLASSVRQQAVKLRPQRTAILTVYSAHIVVRCNRHNVMFKTTSSSTPAYLNDLVLTAVPVRPLRSSDAPLPNVPRACVGLFRSRLSTLGTHYHPTLDPAVLWTPSNDTSRPICSDSLNLMPLEPLYLWTLWRYTNAVVITVYQYQSLWCLITLCCCSRCCVVWTVTSWQQKLQSITLLTDHQWQRVLQCHLAGETRKING